MYEVNANQCIRPSSDFTKGRCIFHMSKLNAKPNLKAQLLWVPEGFDRNLCNH